MRYSRIKDRERVLNGIYEIDNLGLRLGPGLGPGGKNRVHPKGNHMCQDMCIS